MPNAPVEFVSGQRGMGKTTYIRTRLISRLPRVVVYDHMGEFYRAGDGAVVYSAGQLVEFVEAHSVGFLRVYFVPTKPTPEEFDIVCRLPFAFPNMTLVVDELDQFAGALSTPEEFRKLIHFGRHAECGFVGASRRPADVSRAFTSQARRFTLFKQTEPRDLLYLRSVVGDSVMGIKDLEPLHYLAFEEGRVLRGTVTPGL